MDTVIVLDWEFSPQNYFEEAVEISGQDYTMTIAYGQAQVKIDSAIFEANSDMREVLHDEINARFLAVQLLTHCPYELGSPTVTRVHADGHRVLFEELSERIGVSDSMNLRNSDENGNVIADLRRDRIQANKSFAELVASRRSDALLVALLQSYSGAVRDPNNELVHLYEIRDALSTKFGGENATRTALSISDPQWSRLGQLCNSEPLRQGRHRGKGAEALRDATEVELIEARGIAQAIIEAYLQYLKTSVNPSSP